MSDETRPVALRHAGDFSIPIWALVFISALFVMTCVSLWGFILITRPTVPQSTSAAEFIIITPLPTQGTPSAATLQPALEAPTATVPPNINPGFINLGIYVQVAHTDGDPLKLRQSPSLSAEVNYLALPSEVLKVENGPTIADGFTWWFLVDPVDNNRNGWAVENYLEATTAP